MATRAPDIVHETRFPLLVLERHDARVDPALLANARCELLDGNGADPEAAFRSGFLLGVQAGYGTHPVCLELAESLRAQMLGRLEQQHGLSFSLSFYKLAEGTPPKADEGPLYEGPHLDTHPELTGPLELLRLLVNLSGYPRRFMYVASDRWRLAEQGVRCGRRDFETLVLPPDTDTRVVVLPGRTDTAIHALKFFASAVPHVGLNDPPEHFLLSFEALADVAAVRLAPEF